MGEIGKQQILFKVLKHTVITVLCAKAETMGTERRK